MLKLVYGSEKTNSFRPTPWSINEENFIKFYGEGAGYKIMQAIHPNLILNFENEKDKNLISQGYSCPNVVNINTYCKMITTVKGTNLIVPCEQEQDEQLLLITMRGGFRGYFSRIDTIGDVTIFNKNSSNKHCCPVAHYSLRLNTPDSFIFSETGRRCGHGDIEIYSSNGYKRMTTEEFNTYMDLNNLS